VRGDLTIFRQRRFVLLFAARTSSVLGSSIGPVALAFGVLELHGATPTTLSIVLAANSITLLAFLLLSGVIADRLPRYQLMFGADGLSAVAWGGIGVMLLTGWAPISVMAILAALAGLGTALFWPAMTGVVPEVVGPDGLQAANGLLRLGTNGARILGFAVAGVMVKAFGPGWAMMLNAAGFGISAALLACLRLPRTTKAESSNVISDLREGWKEFTAKQWLWVVVLQFSIIVGGLEAFYGVLGPVVAKHDLGGAGGWSVVLAGESIGMLAGVAIAIRIRPKHPMRLGMLLTFPLALAPTLLGFHFPLLLVAAGALIGGLCIDIFGVLWETSMQREVPSAALSRVSSYDALGSLMFGPIGLGAAGVLVTWLGPRHALFVAAAAVVVPTAIALCVPSVRSMTWSPPQQPPQQPERAVPLSPVEIVDVAIAKAP
jgi:MFS family permease